MNMDDTPGGYMTVVVNHHGLSRIDIKIRDLEWDRDRDAFMQNLEDYLKRRFA